MRRSSLVPGILVLVLAVFALAACGGGGDDGGGGGDEAGGGAGETTIALNEVGGSGQSGSATLTADGAKTNVLIVVDGGGSSGTQPAHIHEGTCAQLNPEPAYGLLEVQNDFSDSTVDVSLDTLIAGDYAINLHMSPANLETYTSCGNIE